MSVADKICLHDALVRQGDDIRRELDQLSLTHQMDRTALDFVLVALRRLTGSTELLPPSLRRQRVSRPVRS